MNNPFPFAKLIQAHRFLALFKYHIFSSQEIHKKHKAGHAEFRNLFMDSQQLDTDKHPKAGKQKTKCGKADEADQFFLIYVISALKYPNLREQIVYKQAGEQTAIVGDLVMDLAYQQGKHRKINYKGKAAHQRVFYQLTIGLGIKKPEHLHSASHFPYVKIPAKLWLTGLSPADPADITSGEIFPQLYSGLRKGLPFLHLISKSAANISVALYYLLLRQHVL